MSPLTAEPFCTKDMMAAILHDCRFAGGISASGQSAGFGGNLFTRDTLRVLRDVIGLRGYESFVREMLSILPQWQGVKEDPATNEFPDSLTHQVFRQFVGGRQLPDEQVNLARYWTEQWGVQMKHHPINGWQFAIHNSSDGPPLYLITLGEFCRVAGKAILKDSFRHWPTDGNRTVGEAARRCVEYIVRALKRSEDIGAGLYGVPNTNPKQTSPSGVMRDGFDAYVRPDGTAADYSFMAYVENQALVYEALVIAARQLFPEDPDANNWLNLARELRNRTIETLWMEEQSFFAAALDKDGQVGMISSAVFEMLNGPFFTGLKDGPDYVRTLVKKLYSPDFMTAVGMRMTSLEHQNLEGDYYAYQGSGVVWGVANGITTTGLLQYRLSDLAIDLGLERLVEGFNRTRQASEKILVDRVTGEPIYRPSVQEGPSFSGQRAICASNLGQNDQAWSASAALLQLHTDCDARKPTPGTWQYALNQQIATIAWSIPTAQSLPASDQLYVNLTEGERLKQLRAQQLGLSA